MSLLGIDVGATGCKVALVSHEGEMLAAAYGEYDLLSPRPGWAELDARTIWADIKEAIRSALATTSGTEVRALSVSSLGESVVPVSSDRQILGASLLNFDSRGEEFLPGLADLLPDERLYALNGNTLGNHYTLTKLKWIQIYQPELYAGTYNLRRGRHGAGKRYWSSLKVST
ncbi:MAG TPA: FGGY family carbohydrate kinase [Candidatus Sulfomarinibacteraceae bacterium]|nr:FGGY family carbohydrate kinase [Candidatus Sulfomarinibacteraceae bacterium]